MFCFGVTCQITKDTFISIFSFSGFLIYYQLSLKKSLYLCLSLPENNLELYSKKHTLVFWTPTPTKEKNKNEGDMQENKALSKNFINICDPEVATQCIIVENN